MEKQKLIYVESKALFSPSEVSDKAIVFIKDTKEIWTHGVYFSCSDTWATPITLSLTGDTTGSVSIDGSGNASIATTTKYLSGMASSASDCNGTATTLPRNVTYYPTVLNGAANGFPAINNANGILSLNVHGYSYTHLLGFSSDGNIYHRRRSAGTWETTWKTILNSSNYTNFLDSVYLKKSGGTMTGILTLTTGSAYINDTASGYSIYGSMEASNTFIGISGLATIFSGAPSLNMVLRTSGDNLYHYNHSKSARYLILDTNNYSTYVLPLSGGTMKGALNFANNTWNKVGNDAYMGDCNVAGMIGIKGSNAATGFAMYNNSGTLLGKLYASGSDLYWSGIKLLTSTGSAREAYLLWGGTNLRNNSSPIDTALAPILGANRLAFLNPDAIDIEYSKDSGTTWTDYNISDSNKVLLFAGGNNYTLLYLGGDSTQDASIDRTSWRLRITISAIGYSLYCNFLKFMIYVTTYGNALRCALLGRTYSNVQNDVDTWVTFLDASLGGWSGWNTINYPAGITIPHKDHYGQIRFEFYMTSLGTTGKASCILKIMGFASACWEWPSSMAGYGNIYSHDWQLNATFPAKVTATGGFSGNLTGNVTGNADTASFLKCPDKRYSYPALIVTSSGNIGAAFMSASKLGLSGGGYYDAVILRGYTDYSGGQENALLFSKSTSSVYHSQYAFGSTTTWGTMYKFLDSGNYSSYALPLSGGTLTGKLTMLSNALDNLPLVYRTDSSNISGIRFLNTLGYLGTIGMNAVNGSLYIMDTNESLYPVLDSRNYSDYTINYANALQNYTGYAGIISDGKLYYNNMLLFDCFDPNDNLGKFSYELIAELTNYNTGANTSYVTYGISGFMWSSRAGYCLNSSAYPITAIVSIGPSTFSRIRVPVTTDILVPFIVKYNDKYYLALRKKNASTLFYFMGQKLNLLTTRIKVDDASLIKEVKGPETETSTSKYYYNTNGTPQEYLHAGNYSSYALPLTGGTLTGKLTAPKYIVSGGTSSQFLKADGSLDSSNYYKIGTELPIYRNAHVRDQSKGSAIFGVVNIGSDLVGAQDLETVYAGETLLPFVLRTSSDDLYHYNHAKDTRYKILDSFNISSYALPLSGGTLGSTSTAISGLNILSSTARLQLLAYSDTTTYIQSGNSDFSGNATLRITGYGSNTGTNLYFNFANIYCRANSYTNIDSGNYSTYALPLSGGTLTGTLISRDVRPSTNLSYSLGTSSYYYNYVYANYFKKNGSSDSYVLLGGGGHKAVSDFAPNNVAILSSSGTGNSDLWTLVFEKSYPDYWYSPTTMFYIRSVSAGCGILCFYNYWNSGTQLNDYEREVWFFGAGKSETGTTFGGANRDINDYLRIYIDKANFKYCIYYNRYNDLSLQILELLFFTVPEAGEYTSTGTLRSSFFTNSTTVVSLPTESSTLVRVPIKTTYNHDRTIKTTKSIYASSFYENSDIRLKENVRGIDLSDLTKQVDLVQFNFKDSDTKKYGVIALLLEQVGLQNLVYENDGKKAVDYISLLVLEIQRLRNEIGELKLEINKKS